MKILLAADAYPPARGGVASHVRRLGQALSARGHDVCVVAPGAKSETLWDGNVAVRLVRMSLQRLPHVFADASEPFCPPWGDRALRQALEAAHRELGADIVHAHGWVEFSARQLPGSVPLVVTLHDYGLFCPQKGHLSAGAPCGHRCGLACRSCPGSDQSTLKRVGLATALRLPRKDRPVTYIAVSSAVAQRHRDFGGRGGDAVVVPNFIDAPEGDWHEARADGQVLFVGPEEEYKGFGVLRSAQAVLRERGVRHSVLHVGGPVQRDEGDYVAVGRKSGAELAEIYRRASIVVAPAVYPDPCPTVVLEAMGAARPVIVSRCGGHTDLVDETCGIFVQPGDAMELADAIAKLVVRKDVALEMGRRGRQRVAQFTTGAVVPRIERLYDEVLREGKSRVPGAEVALSG
jgi:glycosyltransferase involved in cell wall biosynthesis